MVGQVGDALGLAEDVSAKVVAFNRPDQIELEIGCLPGRREEQFGQLEWQLAPPPRTPPLIADNEIGWSACIELGFLGHGIGIISAAIPKFSRIIRCWVTVCTTTAAAKRRPRRYRTRSRHRGRHGSAASQSACDAEENTNRRPNSRHHNPT